MQAAEEFTPSVDVVPSTFAMSRMTSFLNTLRDQKRRLRAEARARRNAYKNDNENFFTPLAAVFIREMLLDRGAVVASYFAVHDEINPDTLNKALRVLGHRIALPVVVGKRRPLIFRLYREGDSLLANLFGVFEPTSSAEGIEPDVLLVPLLAFDSRHNRLGYGGGYYDRTIKTLRARKPLLTVGLAYAYQEFPEIPVGMNDVPLDKIVTDRGVF